jgi:hypothetical protein
VSGGYGRSRSRGRSTERYNAIHPTMTVTLHVILLQTTYDRIHRYTLTVCVVVDQATTIDRSDEDAEQYADRAVNED